MDDQNICTRCGTPLKNGECPQCDASIGEDVIEVEATPLGPERGLEVQQESARHASAPQVQIRRFEVHRQGGGGCCIGGCLIVVFLLFLLYRGFVSLF